MKKADCILILAIMAASLLSLIPLFSSESSPETAVVRVENEERMRIDLRKDGEYETEGTNGTIHISVKDGSVAVTQENSPHHYCSMQGYVSSPHTPIVCLPNHTVITIESASGAEEDTVIS